MKSVLKQVIGVPLGVFLIILPVRTMFMPHDVTGGGVGGIAIILYKTLHLNMSVVTLIINGSLLILGLALLGKKFFVKTAYGSLLFPIFMQIIPSVSLSDDIILSVLFGALSTAVGVNILYHLDASCGGTTIPPLIFKKYFGTNESIGLFLTDATVVVASLFIFGVEAFMYSALVIMLTSLIMEYLSNGMTRKKVIYIMSKEHKAIAKDLFNVIGRGATNLVAQGAYTDEEKTVLMIVLNDRDLHKLQSIIAKHDPKAFTIVQTVSKVTGDAFTYHSVVR